MWGVLIPYITNGVPVGAVCVSDGGGRVLQYEDANRRWLYEIMRKVPSGKMAACVAVHYTQAVRS